MPTIYDNITKESEFATGLKQQMESAVRLDCCVGYFNLRGWDRIREEIDKLPGALVRETTGIYEEKEFHRHCRILVGMTSSPKDELLQALSNPAGVHVDNKMIVRQRTKLVQDLAAQLTYGIPTQKDEDTLKGLLHQLKNGKVVVKLFLRHQLHAKLYICHTSIKTVPIQSLLGSSNFTLSGLSQQGELNVDVYDADAGKKLEKWFEDLWNDRFCIDITNDLVNVLENSWARYERIPPYHVYLKMAYHLSREAREGLSEYNISRQFSKELLDYQQAAVKIAASYIHRRGGVLIGDVVGLGKTIVATAIAKILEDDLYYNTLIVCPKNLVPMWEKYREKYGLHAKILSHSVLIRDLPSLKRYRLVIVDESHNFRNHLGQTYQSLHEYIHKNESKVILLSATPYNKSYIDLANQLKLFIPEDYDLGITPEGLIKSLPGGMLDFNRLYADINPRTINAFEKSEYAEDWREIMKLFMVRRTRSFIKTNYAQTDKESGRKYLEFSSGEKSFFPSRIPKKVEFGLDENSPDDQYARLYSEDTVSAINDLFLPRYGLQKYVKKGVQTSKLESRILANLSRAGKSILGFCRTGFYKRLESSGYSFLLSVARHILRNHIFMYALKNKLELPVSGAVVDADIYTDEDHDENQLMDFSPDSLDFEKQAETNYRMIKEKVKDQGKWLRHDIFNGKKMLAELSHDTDILMDILAKAGEWRSGQDRKLEALHRLLTEDHGNEKVIVFTQYADTARYLGKELRKKAMKDVGVAVGASGDVVELVERFSPESNESDMDRDKELRILVATDVLSEGQNLQDSHIVVNYDLPWAIIRLIQRAGRVDRLGQKSPKILCYSFLPEDGIEHIITLRKRLQKRMTENAEIVGSDEIFFEGDKVVNLSEIYSEKAGILDDDEDIEVDLASYAYQIWKNATDGKAELRRAVEKLPDVVYSAKSSDLKGAVVYVRTKENNDAIIWLDEAGKVITRSQFAILKTAECEEKTPAVEKLENHHELTAEAVRIIGSETSSITGTLGRKNSIKYRVYERLNEFVKQQPLLVNEALKQAIDAIYQYPLKESAASALSRQMRAKITDHELAQLICALNEGDELCVCENDALEPSIDRIICSMSLA